MFHVDNDLYTKLNETWKWSWDIGPTRWQCIHLCLNKVARNIIAGLQRPRFVWDVCSHIWSMERLMERAAMECSSSKRCTSRVLLDKSGYYRVAWWSCTEVQCHRTDCHLPCLAEGYLRAWRRLTMGQMVEAGYQVVTQQEGQNWTIGFPSSLVWCMMWWDTRYTHTLSLFRNKDTSKHVYSVILQSFNFKVLAVIYVSLSSWWTHLLKVKHITLHTHKMSNILFYW